MPACNFFLTIWQSISKCFVHSWKTGFAAICSRAGQRSDWVGIGPKIPIRVTTVGDKMKFNSSHLHRRLGRMTGYSGDGLTGSVWSEIRNIGNKRISFKIKKKMFKEYSNRRKRRAVYVR